MSTGQAKREELKELIREVVREELSRMKDASEPIGALTDIEEETIDEMAGRIFDQYDDVFSALA